MCRTEDADAGIVYEDGNRTESGLGFCHQSCHIAGTSYIRNVGKYATSQASELSRHVI